MTNERSLLFQMQVPMLKYASHMTDCHDQEKLTAPDLIRKFLPLILLIIIFGLLLGPFYLKNLRGHSKIFMLLQQLSIILYLIITFLQLFWQDQIFLELSELSEVNSKKRHKSLLFVFLLTFPKNIFYYQHYAFSALQAINYRQMICKPMHYQDYICTRNVIKRVLFSIILSILISIDILISWGIQFHGLHIHSSKTTLIYKFLRASNVVIFSMFKIAYTGALIKIASKIIRSLRQSKEMNGRNIGPLFVVSCLIPLLNNFLYLSSEIPNKYLPFMNEIMNEVCEMAPLDLTVVVPTFVAFAIQCTGYLLCFPALRKKLFCGFGFWFGQTDRQAD